VEDFIAGSGSTRGTEDGSEVLDAPARAREAAVLGLRLLSGIEESTFAARFGAGSRLTARFEELIGLGLLERTEGWVRATGRGLQLGSEVARRLL
jgi:coproporphyrinogen III oxidase-like Fe-S oxidoreductase